MFARQPEGSVAAALGDAPDVVAWADTVPVTAKDYSNNSATVKYKVSVSGNGNKTLTYDANGNMLGDGTRSYEWDAENRLTAIVNGSLRSEFTYDGMSRRVRIVEKNGSTVTSDKRLLWDGNTIVAELNSAGNTVNKLYYVNGFTVSGSKYFYTRDHLGSIREVTDNSGTLQARYDYDPYGIRSKVAGTGQDADFSYAGYYLHQPSGMYLTKYRAYGAGLGRWLSRDPADMMSGINIYAYSSNRPTFAFDPLGLLTVYGGAGITGTNGASGISAGAGSYWNTDGSSGYYTYQGQAQGAMISGGLEAGFILGSPSDFAGPFENFNISGFGFGISFQFNPCGKWLGMGWGPADGFGGAVTHTSTNLY